MAQEIATDTASSIILAKIMLRDYVSNLQLIQLSSGQERTLKNPPKKSMLFQIQ